MTRRSPKPLSDRMRSLYRWHRWLGVISALFVIWLAISGVLLEHSHDLRLDRTPVRSPWLQSHYGVESSVPEQGLQLDGHWLSHINGHLYLDQKLIGQDTPPSGLAHLDGLWVIACRESIWLLNAEAEVLERISGLDLPGRITAMASQSGRLLLATERGNFAADPMADNWPDWQAYDGPLHPAYRRAPLPSAMAEDLAVSALDQGLNWERLLLDAHSGRLLGRYGVWAVDVVAAIFVVLGISGLWLWLRFQRSNRRRRLRRRRTPSGRSE